MSMTMILLVLVPLVLVFLLILVFSPFLLSFILLLRTFGYEMSKLATLIVWPLLLGHPLGHPFRKSSHFFASGSINLRARAFARTQRVVGALIADVFNLNRLAHGLFSSFIFIRAGGSLGHRHDLLLTRLSTNHED